MTGPRQRHSPRQLFWRGVIAAAGNVAISAGLYPLVPHLQMAMRRRRVAATRAVTSAARTLGAEWSVAIGLTAARPLGFFGLPRGRVRGPRPIIALHGYAMSRTNFMVLASRLTRAGLGPMLGFEYWTLGKVASAAHKLAGYVEAVCAHTGADEVDLIGHSMGGVVARYYVALAGGSPRVRNLVTIGSPHRGTDAAAVGIGVPRRELLTGSPLLERLAAAPRPADTRVIVIWSRGDALVSRPQEARIPADVEIVYDELGHMSMLASRRVARAIADLLAES